MSHCTVSIHHHQHYLIYRYVFSISAAQKRLNWSSSWNEIILEDYLAFSSLCSASKALNVFLSADIWTASTHWMTRAQRSVVFRCRWSSSWNCRYAFDLFSSFLLLLFLNQTTRFWFINSSFTKITQHFLLWWCFFFFFFQSMGKRNGRAKLRQ